MVKKTITFTDYNGTKRTQDYFFDLNETELLELEIDTIGGLEEKLDRTLKRNDQREIYNLFKDIVRASYGEKSDDGLRFVKDDDAWKNFIFSPAYNEMIKGFLNDPKSITEFVEGLMPKTDMTAEQKAKYEAEKNKIFAQIDGGKNVQN